MIICVNGKPDRSKSGEELESDSSPSRMPIIRDSKRTVACNPSITDSILETLVYMCSMVEFRWRYAMIDDLSMSAPVIAATASIIVQQGERSEERRYGSGI